MVRGRGPAAPAPRLAGCSAQGDRAGRAARARGLPARLARRRPLRRRAPADPRGRRYRAPARAARSAAGARADAAHMGARGAAAPPRRLLAGMDGRALRERRARLARGRRARAHDGRVALYFREDVALLATRVGGSSSSPAHALPAASPGQAPFPSSHGHAPLAASHAHARVGGSSSSSAHTQPEHEARARAAARRARASSPICSADLDVPARGAPGGAVGSRLGGEATNDAFAPLRAPRLTLTRRALQRAPAAGASAGRPGAAAGRFPRATRRARLAHLPGRWSLTASLFAGPRADPAARAPRARGAVARAPRDPHARAGPRRRRARGLCRALPRAGRAWRRSGSHAAATSSRGSAARSSRCPAPSSGCAPQRSRRRPGT